MPERMTKEEAKIEQAIRAARIAKQKLLEETRNAFPLEDGTEVVKVKRPKAENVTIKVPNQKKEGFNWDGRESSPASLKKTDSRYINSEYSDMDDSELMDLVMDKIGSMSKIELIEILER